MSSLFILCMLYTVVVYLFSTMRLVVW